MRGSANFWPKPWRLAKQRFFQQKNRVKDQFFLSVKQAAAKTSLSTRTLYLACQRRDLRYYKVGRRIVIDEKDLIEFVSREAVERVDDWGEKLGLK